MIHKKRKAINNYLSKKWNIKYLLNPNLKIYLRVIIKDKIQIIIIQSFNSNKINYNNRYINILFNRKFNRYKSKIRI
jgi:hypothetical protein